MPELRSQYGVAVAHSPHVFATGRFMACLPMSELRDAITMAMEPEDQADCMAFIVYNDKQPELLPFYSWTVMLKLHGKDSYWTCMNVFSLLECLA